jgi:hypothetical protein
MPTCREWGDSAAADAKDAQHATCQYHQQAERDEGEAARRSASSYLFM